MRAGPGNKPLSLDSILEPCVPSGITKIVLDDLRRMPMSAVFTITKAAIRHRSEESQEKFHDSRHSYGIDNHPLYTSAEF